MTNRVSTALVQLPHKPHALYRFFDRTDVLLYVGITMDLPTRLKNHRRDKPWWVHVHHITIEQFDTREEALAAEAKAIRTDGPLHNDQHNPHVWVEPVAPKPESIDGRWLSENWRKIPATVRDHIEIPAWTKGRLELAQELLDGMSHAELAYYTAMARTWAEDDEEEDVDGPELFARTALAAFTEAHHERSKLADVLEELLRGILGDDYDDRFGAASVEVAEKLGQSASEYDPIAWAAWQLSYEVNARYFDSLTPPEQAIWAEATRSLSPYWDEPGFRQNAGRHARRFKQQGALPFGLCVAHNGESICTESVRQRVQIRDCACCSASGLRECSWHRMWCDRHIKEFAESGGWRDADGSPVQVADYYQPRQPVDVWDV